MSCTNQDLEGDTVLFNYEEDGVVYCFTEKISRQLLRNPINPYTGRLLALDFYQTLYQTLEGSQSDNLAKKLIDYKTDLDESCTQCETLHNCTSNVVLSEETLNWLRTYTHDTTMSQHKYYTIPINVRLELKEVKRCTPYKVYRGMNFQRPHLHYGLAIVESLDGDNGYIIKQNRPLSTSTDISWAKEFTVSNRANSIFGLLIEIEVENYDVLLDVNLLSRNKSVIEYERRTGKEVFRRHEHEVILLPGNYNAKVVKSTVPLDTVVEFSNKYIQLLEQFGQTNTPNKQSTFAVVGDHFTLRTHSDWLYVDIDPMANSVALRDDELGFRDRDDIPVIKLTGEFTERNKDKKSITFNAVNNETVLTTLRFVKDIQLSFVNFNELLDFLVANLEVFDPYL